MSPDLVMKKSMPANNIIFDATNHLVEVLGSGSLDRSAGQLDCIQKLCMSSNAFPAGLWLTRMGLKAVSQHADGLNVP